MENKVTNILFLTTIITVILSVIITYKLNQRDSDYSVGSNIAIMVYDEAVKDYIQSNNIPIGSYKLNEEKTICSAGGTVLDYKNQYGTLKYNLGTSDECYIYFDAYYGAVKTIMDLYKGQGTIVGDGKLYLHDETLDNSAKDNSYRYSGKDPDNYVCFEGDTCDDNHKYRIIGLFGENIKVIKMISVGDKVWNSSNVNTWSGSTMDTYLNGAWLTSFAHGDLVENYEWSVGGNNSSSVTPKEMYDTEMNRSTVVNRKVGLMYASDYGYAAANNYWTTSLYSYNQNKGNDWLLLTSTSFECTISRVSGRSSDVFLVNYGGLIGYNASSSSATRPSFYLKASVKIKDGDGSSENPYIIGS